MRCFPLFAAAGIGLGLLAATVQADIDSTADLPYRSAVYDYQLQRYQPAHISLMKAVQQDGAMPMHRQMLMARLYVEQQQFDEAQKAFGKLDLDDVPTLLRNDVFFSLAKLHYAEDRCSQALAALDKAGRFQGEQDAHARFIEATCLVRAENISLETVRKAEQVLRDGLRGDRPADQLLWFSYGLYNLAVAAANINQLTESDRLYLDALRYTDSSKEGLALAEKIRLSRANVNYALNRYHFAMNAYKQLPLNGYWQDEALLGYGWAAFRNYQLDVALESWRQLVNLPYKSMSVYQGYLVIPFVLEKANAYMQALDAYDNAVKQYTQVTDEIDDFSDKLTLQKINEHAAHYYNKRGEFVEPLHPLLASTYVQPEFLGLIEKIGMLTGYKQQMAEYDSRLVMLMDYRRQFDGQASARADWRQQQQQKVAAQLQVLEQALPSLVDGVLAFELGNPDADKRLSPLYQQYAAVRAQSERLAAGSQKQQLQQRLNRLQGVLLLKLAERKQAYTHADAVSRLISRQQALNVRFTEYQVLSEKNYPPVAGAEEVAQLRQRISQTVADTDAVLLVLQQQLLQQTLDALAEQRQHIENYKNKARIASANLREEFYQRGGSRLWY